MKPEGLVIVVLWVVMRLVLLFALAYLFWREVKEHRRRKNSGERRDHE